MILRATAKARCAFFPEQLHVAILPHTVASKAKGAGVILREFLYVDTEKVRSMLAQLEGGVAEEERQTDREERRLSVGPRGVAQHFQGSGNERYTQKSLGDAIFPMLEGALESESLLRDISEEVADTHLWRSGEIERRLPPGTLVRITAPGSLFDARYVAGVFSGFAAVSVGLQELGALPVKQNQSVKKGQQPQGARRSSSLEGGNLPPQLEDSIPPFSIPDGDGGIAWDAKTLRSIVRVSRGVFAPGLHINLSPADSEDVLISARLQEGRQYLESEADVLFARYGTEQQEWTVVGSIGHYGPQDTSMPDPDFMASDGSVVRHKFAQFINSSVRHLSGLGFVDLPQNPGFSVIPFAVYRSIRRFTGELALPGN